MLLLKSAQWKTSASDFRLRRTQLRFRLFRFDDADVIDSTSSRLMASDTSVCAESSSGKSSDASERLESRLSLEGADVTSMDTGGKVRTRERGNVTQPRDDFMAASTDGTQVTHASALSLTSLKFMFAI